jgi:hypothetical protein
MTDATHTPITLCWHCDHMLDAASPVEGQAVPSEGAVSLCLYCGAVAIFEEDLKLRAPTEEELDEIVKEREFRKTFAEFSWHRQYIMIQENLLRRREDPDR